MIKLYQHSSHQKLQIIFFEVDLNNNFVRRFDSHNYNGCFVVLVLCGGGVFVGGGGGGGGGRGAGLGCQVGRGYRSLHSKEQCLNLPP